MSGAPKNRVVRSAISSWRDTLLRDTLLRVRIKTIFIMDDSDHDNTAAHEAAPPDESPPQLTKGGRKALKAAMRVERHMSNNSKISSAEAELYVPRFDSSELVLGELLGTGGFNDVYDIDHIALDDYSQESEHAQAIMASGPQVELRRQAASDEKHRFAVKFLNKRSLADPDRYCIGAADLVLEAKFLASLDNVHIIKLRGMPANGTASVGSCEKLSYFLILDRLPTTLNQRMDQWHKQQDQLVNPGGVRKLWAMASAQKKTRKLAVERLQVALDVADALEYLHSQRIIYRDLKVENIGFDVNNTTKLFDFGLAKELKPGKYSETYHLTGHTGSLRYMSPEVARYLPYNLSADIYSFGILLWHLYGMEMPFDDMSRSAHSHLVVYGGERPTIDKTWPEPLVNIMTSCWEEAPYKRPTMPEVTDALSTELRALDDSGHSNSSSRRRSGSFVLNRDNIAEQPRQPQTKPRGFVDKVFQRLPSNHRAIVA